MAYQHDDSANPYPNLHYWPAIIQPTAKDISSHDEYVYGNESTAAFRPPWTSACSSSWPYSPDNQPYDSLPLNAPAVCSTRWSSFSDTMNGSSAPPQWTQNLQSALQPALVNNTEVERVNNQCSQGQRSQCPMLHIPALNDHPEMTWTSTSFDLDGSNGYVPPGNASNLFDPSDRVLLPPENQGQFCIEGADPTFDYDTEHYSSFACALQSDIDAEISGHGEELAEFDKCAPGRDDGPDEPEICLGLITGVQCRLVDDAENKHNYEEPFPCRFFDKGVALRSQNFKDVGVIDIKHGGPLRKLRNVASSLRCEAYIRHDGKTLPKSSRRNIIVNVRIVLYSARSDSDKIGEELSEANIFLQEPTKAEISTEYYNPHVLMERGDRITPFFRNEKPRHPTIEEAALEIINAQSSEIEENLRVDSRITTRLQSHQRYALFFMMLRERNVATDDRLTLWEAQTLGFRHKVTYERQETRPLECRGGLLADDMGMGKSLSTLVLVMQTLHEAREFAIHAADDKIKPRSSATLVISPLTAIHSWCNEIRRHVEPGHIKAFVYVGNAKLRLEDLIERYGIVITTYDKLKASQGLRQIRWFRVVLDEAHLIKNASTKLFKAVMEIDAECRWCLSGTPLHNKLDDIFSLTRFLRSRPFDDLTQARQLITRPLQQGQQKGLDNLKSMMATFSLRRLKNSSLLPPCLSVNVDVFLTGSERKHYKSVAASSLKRKARLAAVEMSFRTTLFQDLLPLRQICCHGVFKEEREERQFEEYGTDIEVTNLMGSHSSPAVLDHPQTPTSPPSDSVEDEPCKLSSKLSKVVKKLTELGKYHEKSLVFSSWKTTFDVLEPALESRQIQHLRIDGSTKFEERQEIMRNFTDNHAITVLLMTFGTGSVGLNLTTATNVHIVEPHWNPMVEQQAASRVHRIGQTKPVTIYRYIVKDSVEENIRRLQTRKQHLVELSGLT